MLASEVLRRALVVVVAMESMRHARSSVFERGRCWRSLLHSILDIDDYQYLAKSETLRNATVCREGRHYKGLVPCTCRAAVSVTLLDCPFHPDSGK